MINYNLIANYFNEKKLNSFLDKVFKIFLLNEATLPDNAVENEFATGRILAITKREGITLSWLELLRQKKDSSNLPILAYALAGNISLNRFSWLLKKLGKDAVQLHANLAWPILAIAGTFGSRERLEILLQYYVPTEQEWLQGLFFSIYHGHYDVFVFILNKANEARRSDNLSELAAGELSDNDGNSLLHLATLGSHPEAVNTLGRNLSFLQLEARNNHNNRAIDEAILSGNLLLVRQLAYFYNRPERPLDYNNLVITLIRNNTFVDQHKELLNFLRSKTPNDLILLENWIVEAISIGNDAIANELILELPNGFDTTSLLSSANAHNRQSIAFLLSEERQIQKWIQDMMENITSRLRAYILRTPSQLDSMAQEDGLPRGSYRASHLIQSENRLAVCQQQLHNFFYQDFYEELKKIYRKLPVSIHVSLIFFTQITLQRSELIKKIKESNFLGFKQQLQESIIAAIFILAPDMNALQTLDDTMPNVKALSNTIPDDNSDEGARSFSEKQTHFINRFSEEFDKTYNFYDCLSRGDVIKKPDAMDQLAEVAKTAAIAVLPSINIPLPMCGVPLPFTISLPSGVAVAAVIDLLIFMREKMQQNQASRIGLFFEGTTLRDRVNNIYDCAEFLAARFSDQINLLSHNNAIPRLADMAVARIFRHAMGGTSHVQSRTRSSVFTLFRGLMSPVYNIPDPGNLRKTLIEVAIDALSKYEHNIFFLNQEEEKFLTPDEQLPTHEKPVDWTVKGIFEHTGIRTNGKTYKGDGQEIERYGYINAELQEVKKRSMQPSNLTPSFEVREIVFRR